MKKQFALLTIFVLFCATPFYIKHRLDRSWEAYKFHNNCYAAEIQAGKMDTLMAIGRGLVMQRGPDRVGWNCDGKVVWREVEREKRM